MKESQMKPEINFVDKTGMYSNFDVSDGHMAISADKKRIYSPSNGKISIIEVNAEVINQLSKDNIDLGVIPVYTPLEAYIELSGDADHFLIDDEGEYIEDEWDCINFNIRKSNDVGITNKPKWLAYNQLGEIIHLEISGDNATLLFEDTGGSETITIRVFVNEVDIDGRTFTDDMEITFKTVGVLEEPEEGEDITEDNTIDAVIKIIDNGDLHIQETRLYTLSSGMSNGRIEHIELDDVVYISNDFDTNMQMCVTKSGMVHEIPLARIISIVSKLDIGD